MHTGIISTWLTVITVEIETHTGTKPIAGVVVGTHITVITRVVVEGTDTANIGIAGLGHAWVHVTRRAVHRFTHTSTVLASIILGTCVVVITEQRIVGHATTKHWIAQLIRADIIVFTAEG